MSLPHTGHPLSRRALLARVPPLAVGLTALSATVARLSPLPLPTRVLAAATSSPPTLVCIGDSLTLGAYLTDPVGDPWPARLRTALQSQTLTSWTVINQGIGGNTVIAPPPAGQQSMTDRFQADVLDQSGVTHCIIFGGDQ